MSNKILSLMQIPDQDHDLSWIQNSLQAALELELATIPPYLCGLWSIQSDPSGTVSDLIRGIVLEEMIHLGIVCNLLTGVGAVPQIVSGYKNEIHYPGGLPGGVRPGLNVYLGGLTKDYVRNVYMQIELPEHPLTLEVAQYPTIGSFYDAISDALTTVHPTFQMGNQLTVTFNSLKMTVSPVKTVAEALRGITQIKDQGEGTSTSMENSPYTPDFGNGMELSHYYKFSEIYHGRTITQMNGKWDYLGDPVTFPTVYPMLPIPKRGYVDPRPSAKQALAAFDATFANLLESLQSAWATGSNDTLQGAIGTMFTMKALATKLFAIPLPGGSGVYGPDFVLP